jgi:PAS domain S-box-containing protein
MSVPQLAPLQQDLVQETLLGEALEHGPVAAIVLDEEGRYLAANRLACKLSGYTRDELLAGGAEALAFDPARVKTTMELMARGDLHSGSAVLRRKDGTALACEYRVGETRSGGMPFFVVVFWERSEAD